MRHNFSTNKELPFFTDEEKFSPESRILLFITQLERYAERRPNDQSLVDCALALIEKPDCFNRNCTPGHFTVSAVVINEITHEVAFVLHKKHRMWVNPGGHIDTQDQANFQTAARRETKEECGLKNLEPISDEIFRIRKLPYVDKETGELRFYLDISFVYMTNSHILFVSSESIVCEWIPIAEVATYDLRDEYDSFAKELQQFLFAAEYRDAHKFPSESVNISMGERSNLVDIHTYNTGEPHYDLLALNHHDMNDLIAIARGEKTTIDHHLGANRHKWQGKLWKDGDLYFELAAREQALDQLRRLVIYGLIDSCHFKEITKLCEDVKNEKKVGMTCVSEAAKDLEQAVDQSLLGSAIGTTQLY